MRLLCGIRPIFVPKDQRRTVRSTYAMADIGEDPSETEAMDVEISETGPGVASFNAKPAESRLQAKGPPYKNQKVG